MRHLLPRAVSLPRARLAGVLLAAAPLLAGLAGCASAGIHDPSAGEPMRVALYLYRNGIELTLVNPAHTDPVEVYSRKRSGPSNTKVAPDAVLLDLIEHLGEHGFGEHEEPGAAPRLGASPFVLAFEIETERGTSHWGTSAASPPDVQRSMQECYRHYINEVFNKVKGFQAVENPEGGALFEDAAPVPEVLRPPSGRGS